MSISPKSSLVTYQQVQDAAAQIREAFGFKAGKKIASCGLILGSGLGGFVDLLREKGKVHSLPYSKIDAFPVSSVEGHASFLHVAEMGDANLLIMQGRIHRYEGYKPAQVALPVRVLVALGVEKLILTNAAAGLREDCKVGDLMLIEDHINLTGNCPLIGPNDLRFGPRFLDMSESYSKALGKIAKDCAKKLKLPLREGVYAGVLGPNYETPAEIRMFQRLGADAVGMSTVYETIAARHSGCEVLGISCITNKGAGLSSSKISHEEVQENAAATSGRFTSLLIAILEKLL